MGNGGGGDGNPNYANANAIAHAPAGNQQAVSVSCNVLVSSEGINASLTQTQESGEAESVLVLQLNLQGGTGNNATWVHVAFDGTVELQDGNAITQVEILSDTLGNLVIPVASGQPPVRATSPGTPPAQRVPAAGAPSGNGNPNYPFVNFMTHGAEDGLLQMIVVYGEVKVANPGLQPVLSQVSLPGAGPNVLALQLELVQRAGHWPQQEYRAWFYYGVTAMITGNRRPATELHILNAQLRNVTVAAQNL